MELLVSLFSQLVIFFLVNLRGITTFGPDGIPGDILCNFRHTFCWRIIWYLFQKSLKKVIFPTIFKVNCVFITFKI